MSKAPQPSPALPWKVRLHLAIVSAVTDAACRANGTINRRLLNFFVVKDPPNEKPVNGVKTVDTTIDPSRNLWFRIFSPTEPSDDASLPVIVFFHGGGFAVLSSDSRDYDSVCRRIAREIPAVVISVNYRLAPENRLPSQYDDSFDTLKFLDEGNFDGLPANAKLSRCFLAGDSAGGNLSHHVVCRVSGLELRKVKVIGVISIQPFFGGEERTESEIRLAKAPLVSVQRTDWLWKAFLPEGANRDHEAVNVSGPNAADISEVKYPATIVFVGGLDPLQDRQRAYYEWLKRCGKEAYLIEYPNAVHAFYVFPELPESSLFINEARNFIQKQSSKKG